MKKGYVGFEVGVPGFLVEGLGNMVCGMGLRSRNGINYRVPGLHSRVRVYD